MPTEAIEAIKKSIERKSNNPEKQQKEIEMAIAQLINNIDSWDCREMMILMVSNIHPNIVNCIVRFGEEDMRHTENGC